MERQIKNLSNQDFMVSVADSNTAQLINHLPYFDYYVDGYMRGS